MSELDTVEGHVFISYARGDSTDADRLQQVLEAAGVRVWRDRSDLWPGEDWREKIRHAIIRDALVFIACFSHKSVERKRSYQNEELALAIGQLRLRRPGEPWFIPVRFDDCEIPDLDIGSGHTLTSIHHADLFGDRYDEDVQKLVATILRVLGRCLDSAPSGRSATPEEGTSPSWSEREEVGTVRKLLRSLAVDERLHVLREFLPDPASASRSPLPEATFTPLHADLAEILTHWTESAIVMDPGAALWRATASQREAMGSRIIRFAPAGSDHDLSYNPLSEIRRRTSEELIDVTAMAKNLVNYSSEKEGAAALLLLAAFSRYLEDHAEPSLREMARFIDEPSFYSGMQFITYLSHVDDPARPGHLFAAVLADEFHMLDDQDFVEETFLQIRNVLSPFMSHPLGDRTERHDIPLAELAGSSKQTTVYITFPRHSIEALTSFLRLLGSQLARGLRDAPARRPTLIAFSGADVLSPNRLLDIAIEPIEGVELVTTVTDFDR